MLKLKELLYNDFWCMLTSNRNKQKLKYKSLMNCATDANVIHTQFFDAYVQSFWMLETYLFNAYVYPEHLKIINLLKNAFQLIHSIRILTFRFRCVTQVCNLYFECVSCRREIWICYSPVLCYIIIFDLGILDDQNIYRK